MNPGTEFLVPVLDQSLWSNGDTMDWLGLCRLFLFVLEARKGSAPPSLCEPREWKGKLRCSYLKEGATFWEDTLDNRYPFRVEGEVSLNCWVGRLWTRSSNPISQTLLTKALLQILTASNSLLLDHWRNGAIGVSLLESCHRVTLIWYSLLH